MSNQAEPTAKKLNATQKILIGGIAAIILAVLLVGVLLLSRSDIATTVEPVGGPATGNVVLDDENFEDVIAELNRKAAEGMFEVKMNMLWTFPNGKSASTDAYVANSTANHRTFYFVASLADTGEVIYTSPEIPVGSAVKEFTLSKELKAGKYDCICTYHMLEDGKEIEDSASVTVQVLVLN